MKLKKNICEDCCKGKRISELDEKVDIQGTEYIPFQEGDDNGKFSLGSLKDYLFKLIEEYLINNGIIREDWVQSEPAYKLLATLPELIADRACKDEFGNNINDTYLTREAVKEYIGTIYEDLFVNNPPQILDGFITVDMLSDAVLQLLNSGGAITNFPDDEDITVKDGKLKFKDKVYDPNNYSGMGRTILRKNMVDGVNVLTQEMISEPNVIYVIQYDYDLRGETIVVPDNSILWYLGGSLNNGHITSDDEDRLIIWGNLNGDIEIDIDVSLVGAPADEEDITTESGVLKFKDKEYDTASFSGLGRKYLRKNIVNGKNILTQEMINSANTRYIIQYNYDLNEETITVPEGCTLDFQGGSLNNGTINFPEGTYIRNLYKGTATITGNPTYIDYLADEEDVTTGNGILKFKDKEYSSSNFSGLGRKYLRKNIIDGKNILTQDMINSSNTIYIIQYDYDLNEETITIPEGCTLKFEGGSISNGTLNGANVNICNSSNLIIFKGVSFEDNFTNYINVNWFESTSFSTALQLAINMSNTIYIPKGTYIMDSTVYVHAGTHIIGDNSGELDSSTLGTTITSNKELASLLAAESGANTYYVTIENISFNGNSLVNRGASFNLDRSGNFSHLYINNCTFLGFKGIALSYQYGWVSYINKCSFWNNGQAFYAADAANSLKILNSVITKNNYGIVIANSLNIIISNSVIENNYNFGIAIASCKGVVISNNYFEGGSNEGYNMDDYTIYSDIIITNNPYTIVNGDKIGIRIKNTNTAYYLSGVSIFDNWVMKTKATYKSFIFLPGGERISVYNNTASDYSADGLPAYTLDLLGYILADGYFESAKDITIYGNAGFNESFKCIDNKSIIFSRNSLPFKKSTDFYNNISIDGSNITFADEVAGDFIKDYSVNNKLTLIYSNPYNISSIDKIINTKTVTLPINKTPKSGLILVNLSIKFNRNVVFYLFPVDSITGSGKYKSIGYTTPNEWMNISVLLKYDSAMENISFNIRNVGDTTGNLTGVQISDIFVGDPLEFNTDNYIYQNLENSKTLAGVVSSSWGNPSTIYDGDKWRNEDGTLVSKVSII